MIEKKRQEMIRILVVDNILLMCEVISATLEDEDDIRVVGVTTCLKKALENVEKLNCDLVLLSTNLGEGETIRFIECVLEGGFDTKMLIIGMRNSKAAILSYIEAGASGYVLIEDSLDELLKNIRATVENKAFVAPEVAAALMERVTELSNKLMDIGIDPSAYEELTSREKEILDLIAAGCTNREIADKLTVELGTVKNHVHNILTKLSVNSRKDAAVYVSLIKDVKNTDNIC